MRSSSWLKALCYILFFTFTITGSGQSVWNDSDITEWTAEPDFRGVFLQGRQGYLWGWNNKFHLVRYNGFDLKNFSNGKLIEDENSYNCGYWAFFFEDSRGSLWIGGGCGLYRYDPLTEQFTFLSDEMERAAGLAPSNYTYIIEGQQGLIWITTYDGVFFYDYRTDRFSFVQDRNARLFKVLWEDKSGDIWAGSVPDLSILNFSKISKDSHRVVQSLAFPESEYKSQYGFDYVKRIPDIKKDVYFVVIDKQPMLFDVDKQRIVELSHSHLMGQEEELSAACVGGSSKIILGTNKGRIISYDHQSGIFIPLVKQSLGKSIDWLSIDKSNKLWVTSGQYAELYQIKPASVSTSFVPLPFNHREDSPTMYRMVNLDGTVYFVYPDKLVPVLENKEPIDLNFPFPPESSIRLKFNRDRENNLWILAWDKNNYYLKVDSNWNTLYFKSCLNGREKDCFAGSFFDVAFDENNNLWGAGHFGMAKVDQVSGESMIFGRKDNSTDTINLLKEPGIYALEADGHHLWIGYYNKGISRYHTDTGTFEHYDSLVVDGVPLYNQEVTKIVKDKEGDIWFATGNGLFRYLSSLDSFKVYSTMDGLGENEIYHVLEDQQGVLWVSNWWTLDKFDREEDRFYSFQVGQPGVVEISGGAGFSAIDDKGNFFFHVNEAYQANEGLLIVDPNQFQADKEVPPLLLESFSLANEQLFINDETGILKKNINLTDEVTLRYQQNIFSIRYAALEYEHQDKVNYAFQLEGFDKEWQYVGKKREATYTNLSPGNYTFKVKCQNHHGFWGEPRLLNIRILPPWYRTWLAYFLYFLAATGILLGIRRYELRRQLARTEARQLKELDAFKTRLYTNITHEFRTPLTVILGMAHEVKTDPSRWLEQGIKMIRRNGQHLLRLVNQMLDLSKLESGKLQLELINGDIVPYLAYLAESFQSFAESKEIELLIYKETEHLIMDYDPDKVLHVFSNLLSNAIKFTPEGGRIIFHIRQTVESSRPFLQVKVRDNGAGISEADLPNIFDRFYQANSSLPQPLRRRGEVQAGRLQEEVPREPTSPLRGDRGGLTGTGIGLSLAQQLAQLMGGDIEVSSTLGEGTEFVVSLPVKNTQAADLREEGRDSIQEKLSLFLTEDKTRESLTTASFSDADEEAPLVLLVEDNIDVARYLLASLESNYRVELAYNGQEGIDKALEMVPDIIISDVMMPEKDGFELCDFLKNEERSSHIPIVLLTAKADIASKIAGLKRGADVYLAKPFNQEELRAHLENLIRQRKKLQERYQGVLLEPVSTDVGIKMEDAFLQKIKGLVEENLIKSDFDIPKLAHLAGMSRVQLFRKVKALTDKSPSLFVRAIRLQKASSLLLDTSLNISEIAYDVGFSDPAFFSKTFKEEFGKSPTEFREKERH